MNMMWSPADHKQRAVCEQELPLQFDISLRIAVRDPGLLWRMAAARILAFGDTLEPDVEDLLGPMEDPSVADCLAALLSPRELAGCRFLDFSVAETAVAAHESDGTLEDMV